MRIARPILAILIADCERRRPDEACGLLLGPDGGGAITQVLPMENAWPDAAERRCRYAIDPLAQMRAEQAATADGLTLVGMYHSHPIGPAVPSAFDTDRAWPGYCYLIVGFGCSSDPMPRLWTLDNVGVFEEDQILSETSI